MLLVFVISEFLLWLAFPIHPDPFVWYENESLAYQFDSECMLTLLPNRETANHVSKEDGGGVVYWKTNSRGFRGDELEESPDKRWVVYGDSNIHARFSPLEETFTKQLEGRLRSGTGKTVEVVNAGILGFGPDQNLIRFERDQGELRPDGVVFHVFADNDFGDLVRNRLFDLNAAGELVRSPHPVTPDPSLVMLQEGYAARNYLSASRTWWAVRTALFHVIAMIEGEATGEGRIEEILDLRSDEFAVYEAGGPQKSSMLDDDYDVDVALFPDSEGAQTKRRMMEAVLVKAHALATDAGIDFLVLIQPSKNDLTDGIKPSRRHFEQYADYRPDNLTRFVAEACARNGIDFVNLFDAFRQSDPEQLYLAKQDAHWNAAGQALAAKQVAMRILANGD